jgi:hypothetical protein
VAVHGSWTLVYLAEISHESRLGLLRCSQNEVA